MLGRTKATVIADPICRAGRRSRVWRTILILLALSLLMLIGMVGAYIDLHIGHD